MKTIVPGPARIMLVDDEPEVGEIVQRLMTAANFKSQRFDNPYQALEAALTGEYYVILLDLMMPGLDGMTFLRLIKETRPGIEVVILTARSEQTLSDKALAQGAGGYLVKPIILQKLVAGIRTAMNRYLQAHPSPSEEVPPVSMEAGFLAAGKEGRRLLGWARYVAPLASHVLVTGPAGSGKSQFARMFHRFTGRDPGRLEFLDLARLSRTDSGPALLAGLHLEESAADSTVVGALKRCDGGTLVLENIEHLSHELQQRLQYLFDAGQLTAPPFEDEDFLDVKLVATTRGNLDDLVKAGKILPRFARTLEMVSTTICPLQEREDEILPMAEHFLSLEARTVEKDPPELDPFVVSRSGATNFTELRAAIAAAVGSSS